MTGKTTDVTVTQADRDAAADLLACDLGEPLSPADRFQLESIRSGLDDDDEGVQAFARHRTAHSSEGRSNGAGAALQLVAGYADYTTASECRWEQGKAAGYRELGSIVAAALSAPQGEVERLQRLVDAYRLLAVNEGWSHRMVDAYGHAEYLAHRIAEVDRKASGTVASGYDAAKYLRDGCAAIAQPEAGGEHE